MPLDCLFFSPSLYVCFDLPEVFAFGVAKGQAIMLIRTAVTEGEDSPKFCKLDIQDLFSIGGCMGNALSVDVQLVFSLNIIVGLGIFENSLYLRSSLSTSNHSCFSSHTLFQVILLLFH